MSSMRGLRASSCPCNAGKPMPKPKWWPYDEWPQDPVLQDNALRHAPTRRFCDKFTNVKDWEPIEWPFERHTGSSAADKGSG